MKPCRPLLSSDLWQCCWTATLLATAERHALKPLRSRAPLQCNAAACDTQELTIGLDRPAVAVTGRVTCVPYLLMSAMLSQRGVQNSAAPKATGQWSHLQLAGTAVVDHCDSLPSLPGTLLQQMGADAARPCLSPALLPDHSSHSSPGQQRPAQASDAMTIRQISVCPPHVQFTAASRQQPGSKASSTLHMHHQLRYMDLPLGQQNKRQAPPADDVAQARTHVLAIASPGRKHLVLSSRLAAPFTVQQCLDIPALRCL